MTEGTITGTTKLDPTKLQEDIDQLVHERLTLQEDMEALEKRYDEVSRDRTRIENGLRRNGSELKALIAHLDLEDWLED